MKSTTLSAVAAIATLLWLGVAPTVHAVDLLRGDLVVTRPQGQDRDGQFFTSAVLRVDPVTGDRTVIAVLDQHDNIPFGVAIDTNRELFIARQSRGGPRGPSSSGESDVVHVDPVTGAQTVIVSFPNPPGNFPITLHGIAIDANGDLFVTDARHAQVLRIDPATGDVSVVATSIPFNRFTGIAIDANGDLLVVSFGTEMGGPPRRPRDRSQIHVGSGRIL